MKKSMKIGVMVFIAMLSMSKLTYAQGGSAVPFLLISPDARASGMGEVGTAIADDINAIYWNPGGLGFLDYFEGSYEDQFDPDAELAPFRQVALSYSPWLPQFNADLNYGNFSAGHFFESIDGTVAFNFILMDLGKFTQTDINGIEEGTFNSQEFAVGLSYGTIIAPNLGAGLQLRYIQSNLTPTSEAANKPGTGRSVSFDIGLLWKPIDLWVFEDRLSLGFNLQNVGPKITYISEADPLPTNLRLGIAYNAYEDEFNELLVAFDIAKLLVNRDELGSDPIPLSLISAWQNPGVEVSAGVEYWYQQIVSFRGGFFFEPSSLGNRQFWNLGMGLRYDIFKLDFGYILTVEANNPLANTMRFSMLVDLE
jgi:Type IX secretion system protein PorV